MKRVTFTVSEEVHKLFKMHAARQNLTIKDLFMRSIALMGLDELSALLKDVKKKKSSCK